MSWRDIAVAESNDLSINSLNSQNRREAINLTNSANFANKIQEPDQELFVSKLSANEEAYLRNWLLHIDETSPDEIEYTLRQCESDPRAREWFMSRAYKLSLKKIEQA